MGCEVISSADLTCPLTVGLSLTSERNAPLHYTWRKSSYLNTRLQQIGTEFQVHRPVRMLCNTKLYHSGTIQFTGLSFKNRACPAYKLWVTSPPWREGRQDQTHWTHPESTLALLSRLKKSGKRGQYNYYTALQLYHLVVS